MDEALHAAGSLLHAWEFVFYGVLYLVVLPLGHWWLNR